MTELRGSPGDGVSDGWLTPTAAAIAGFTLAVLSLLTIGAWALALQTFINRNGAGAFSDVATARNLGGATVVLGVLGLVVAFLTVVAGLVAAN